ncbi:MAG: COX15/CtaA family protein [Chloroflexi bacterium]|nr:COX15/CtaA family protein [Chloroflexota bacterium]
MKTDAAGAERNPTPGGFRWLVLATGLTTFGLIVLGGVVRTTESGDACPDWPLCNGELIPAFDSAVLIEFSHRLLASIVGILVLAVAVWAWRSQRGRPLIVWGATAALLLVGFQIVLGGLTVLNDLPPDMVTAHLALAATLLATLGGLAVVSFDGGREGSEPRSDVPAAERSRLESFRNLALVAALATFALMLSGSYVSGSGAGLAFSDWPLFNGSLLPGGGRLAVIHATHRLAAAAIGLFIAYVAVRAWRDRRALGLLAAGSMLALGLYVAQIFVGASNVWTLLQPAAGAAHLGLAVAIWTTLVVLGVAAQVVAHPISERAATYERRGPGVTARGRETPVGAAPGTLSSGGSS